MVAVTERMAAAAARKEAAEVTAAAVITMKDMKAAAMGKAGSGNGNGWGRGVGNGVDGKTGDEPATKVGSVAGQEVGDDWDVNNCKNLERDEEGNICFEKVPYRKIVEEYVKQKNGDPGTGTRHAWLLSMARNFRYICDFDKRLLLHKRKNGWRRCLLHD